MSETNETMASEEENTTNSQEDNLVEPTVLDSEESVDEQVEKLTAALKEEKEKALRAHAEMVNFRKRQEKEKGVWNQMAIKDVISSILDPLDNLERTVEAANVVQDGEEQDPKLKNLADGLSMVLTQFNEVFQRKNVMCIDPKGDTFNPNEHEAYGHIETEEVEEGLVATVFRKGYKIGDQLIRTATVQIAKKPSTENETSEKEA